MLRRVMPVEIQLDYDRGVPIYRQITDAVLAALSTGRLSVSEQLPTIHELARRLGVNPNTVARSYRDLERDGHIVATRGRGTFPAPRTPEPADREQTLQQIFDRALHDAARHKIPASELVAYFQEALHDHEPTR
jgi:GntR family transcriptional regulator